MRVSLYIHIPFCRYKCYYCDFISYPLIQDDVHRQYVKQLVKEIKWWHRLFTDATLYTVYIGGGTPAVLSLNLLEDIVKAIYKWDSPIEFTIEANPEDITLQWINSILSIGINRVSVGIQSLSDRLLKLWGRNHTSKESINALEILSNKQINFNIDMIYPTYMPSGETVEFVYDIDFILRYIPPHLSVYLMDIHQGTLAYTLASSGKWHPVDEDIIFRDIEKIYGLLREKGYRHYEISNYALPGYESLHNMVYWNQEFYIGVGVSAAGFVSGVRYHNLPTIQHYLKGNVERKYYVLISNDWLVEYGLMALRLIGKGISKFKWQQLGGDWDMLISRAKDNSCLSWTEDRVFIKDDVSCVLISNVIIEEMLEPWL